MPHLMATVGGQYPLACDLLYQEPMTIQKKVKAGRTVYLPSNTSRSFHTH